MASGGWVAELDKKEHKNWVMVGCALNITKNGITPKIQKKMEAWYQSLVSSPPLQSLPSCTCAPRAPKCVTCVTWELELTRHHRSPRPKICWNNSDRKQWGSLTGAWEIAKLFMPTLGSRKLDVIDAKTTDIGGLLNLLEWCPFINPPLSRAVLSSARDQCRNHWAHAPKQELQDADVPTIFGHLNSLLRDAVFISDKVAQKASKDLQDLSLQGLVNVRDSEIEALHVLRQSLVADLKKCQDDLSDVKDKVVELDAETKTFIKVAQQDLSEVKEQGDLKREEICTLSTRVSKVEKAAKRDISEVKEQSDLNRDEIGKLSSKLSKVEVAAQKDLSEVKEQGDLNREDIGKLRQELKTRLTEVEENLSSDRFSILNAVDDFNRQLNNRDDLEKAFEVIHDDVEVVRNSIQNVVFELKDTQSQVANFETNLASMKCGVQEVANEAASNKNMISGLQRDVMEVKEEVGTLKGNASQRENDDDDEMLCTAPRRLTSFTGRKSALEWLERNLVLEVVENSPGANCCTKAISGLGGCGKTSLAVEFVWSYKNRFPGGVFWINGETDENINKSVVEILALRNMPASTTENIDDTLNRFLTWLSKKELPWLLVLDNVDELQDPMCSAGIKKIAKGPWQRNSKSVKHGHILLTTRQNAKDARVFLKLSNGDCLELQCFSEEEGALFLMQRTSLGGESVKPEAISLARELGGLPLALEQAAAYISASPIPLSFKDYLDKYQAVKMRLLMQQPITALSMEARHRLSVHTTWEMNFEYVKETSPAAASMMRIAAFLASENVPVDVINPGFPELDQEELRECARSKIDIASLLKVLSSYSLFSVDHQIRVFSVHKLVQEVVRESLTGPQKIEALVAATRLLHSALVANSEPCFKSSKHDVKLVNLSELKEKERSILVSLVLNFHRLKNHMEFEINSSEGHLAHILYNGDIIKLCELVCVIISNNVFFSSLRAELCDFQLKAAKMCDNPDPNYLLVMMVSTSLSNRNCPDRKKYEEAKKLAQETVLKLAELEKSGFIIKDDIKYLVLEHMASYYALEGQWEKNYNALLELEDLPLSDEKTVDLQILIARAENYLSTGNFQRVLRRYEKALELARRIYPSDHHELLRVLQFITSHFQVEGRVHEARQYAKEALKIAKRQPPASDCYIKGITSSLLVLCNFDPHSAEETLLGILKDKWPLVHRSIRSRGVDDDMDTSEGLVDESSRDHAAMVLEGLMQCFVVISTFSTQQKKNKLHKQKETFYRRIAEILLSLRKKLFGECHPGVKEAYDYLAKVHEVFGNQKEAHKLETQARQCNEKQVHNPYLTAPRCDLNVIQARKYKEFANNLFKSGDYSKALELYNEALHKCPNDAKLFTNRAAAYLKLSEQSRATEEQQKLFENALQDTDKAITADASWVKGYYWRAVCLAKLGQRGPSLAAAAVAKHLFPSQCAQIPAVVEKFGSYNVMVVTTVEDLNHATERTENNPVTLVKEGRYELPNPLNAPTNAVLVGLDHVQITCTKGVPLQLDKTVYIENITLSPTMESITKLKEKAKECLNRGELDKALSLYSNALTTCPNNPKLLTTRASTYLKSAEQKKDIPSERKLLLELALKDCEIAIKADPSWLLGYSTKALTMVELDRKNQALATAAVFKHLSSGRDIDAVSRRYGRLQFHVVESSDELRCALQGIKKVEGVNQVVLIKEGEYVLEKSVQIKPPIVVAGLGKVTVSCNTGTPFHFKQEHFVENVKLSGTCPY